MIQLKLNWFGGAAEQQLDVSDTKDDGIYTITHKGITYNIPTSTLNIGTTSDITVTNDAKKRGLEAYIRWFIDNNGNLEGKTAANFREYLDENSIGLLESEANLIFTTASKQAFKDNLAADIGNINTAPGLTPPGTTDTAGLNVDEAKLGAFNQYYQDVYSLAPGTGGANMLNRLEQSYMNQAQQQATLADVGFQQAALQQAQTVKQITDQVRSERMARLRAGMSESQIANQDMQMLMANVNTLNQNAQMLNDQRLQAQLGMNTAQDQAYQDFLGQANQRGQVASAFAAADAGDAYQQTIRQMTTLYGANPANWTTQQWQQVSREVTGFNPNKNT